MIHSMKPGDFMRVLDSIKHKRSKTLNFIVRRKKKKKKTHIKNEITCPKGPLVTM